MKVGCIEIEGICVVVGCLTTVVVVVKEEFDNVDSVVCEDVAEHRPLSQ